jgi:hypothetical protein
MSNKELVQLVREKYISQLTRLSGETSMNFKSSGHCRKRTRD